MKLTDIWPQLHIYCTDRKVAVVSIFLSNSWQENTFPNMSNFWTKYLILSVQQTDPLIRHPDVFRCSYRQIYLAEKQMKCPRKHYFSCEEKATPKRSTRLSCIILSSHFMNGRRFSSLKTFCYRHAGAHRCCCSEPLSFWITDNTERTFQAVFISLWLYRDIGNRVIFLSTSKEDTYQQKKQKKQETTEWNLNLSNFNNIFTVWRRSILEMSKRVD